MAVEDVAVRVRRKLNETFDAEETSYLMDRPPGGWSDLVTNHTLDVKLDALRTELRGEMALMRAEIIGSVDRRLRAQTWVMTSTLIAGMGAAIAIGRIG
jgi:hypothetical protein